MKCPICNSTTRVTTTYWNKGNSNRRRRECTNCKCRFTTRETVQAENLPEPVAEVDPRQLPLELEPQGVA